LFDKTFQELLECGSMGEEVIKCYYCAKGSTVIDVSADKEYQNKDIDFIIDG